MGYELNGDQFRCAKLKVGNYRMYEKLLFKEIIANFKAFVQKYYSCNILYNN